MLFDITVLVQDIINVGSAGGVLFVWVQLLWRKGWEELLEIKPKTVRTEILKGREGAGKNKANYCC